MAFKQLGVGKEGKSGINNEDKRHRQEGILRRMMGKLYIGKNGNLKLNNQLLSCICTMSKEMG